jgi:hypothetical protein
MSGKVVSGRGDPESPSYQGRPAGLPLLSFRCEYQLKHETRR